MLSYYSRRENELVVETDMSRIVSDQPTSFWIEVVDGNHVRVASVSSANGVEGYRDGSKFFDELIQHYVENEKEIEWSVPNNGEDGIDNIYQKLDNDLAVYLKFRKTNDVSFERLEEYRCEMLDGHMINRIIEEFNDIKIYRGKLFRVL